MRRLILALTLLATTAAFAETDTIRRGFNVAPGGTLRLEAGTGNVKIVSGGNGVAVEIVRKARGRRALAQMRDHKIDVHQDGNDVIIDGDLDDRDWGFHWWSDDEYEVQWNVRVPSRYNVDVRTSGGSIDLADIGGTVEARTSGGSITTGRLGGSANLKTSGGGIRIGGASGELVAHTSGGSIEVGDTTASVDVRTSGGSIKIARTGGDVVAHTSGGSIRIEDAYGSVDATTSGGSIHARLSKQPTASSRLSTSGGGVTVLLAHGIGVELDARSSGGGVHTDLPITVNGTLDDNSVRGRIGAGGPKLVVRSSGGGITVRGM